MGRIALIHLPDHTPGAAIDPQTTYEYLSADLQQSGAVVVGLYEFPRRSELTCNGNCVRGKTGAWSRHPDGYMKCSICGSRNKRVRRWLTDALFDWLGANLLGNAAPALFRTPDGYGPRTMD